MVHRVTLISDITPYVLLARNLLHIKDSKHTRPVNCQRVSTIVKVVPITDIRTTGIRGSI
jgi:hypothetical protein